MSILITFVHLLLFTSFSDIVGHYTESVQIETCDKNLLGSNTLDNNLVKNHQNLVRCLQSAGLNMSARLLNYHSCEVLAICLHNPSCYVSSRFQSLITRGWLLLCIIDIGTDQVFLISTIAVKCLMIHWECLQYSLTKLLSHLLHFVLRKWNPFN